MCGICGMAAIQGPLEPALRASVPAMAAAIRHRGPDGEGFFADDRVALGHRRLAIIDRTGGDQPMPNEDRSCWVVFNGEIYNHHDLRARLTSLGHAFRTASDTEVLVHAWEEWGTGCVDRLEGMFAFALYDQRKRQLFLVRDRLGKKPLYYACFSNTLHFASEVKAMQRSPAWQGALAAEALESYLSLGYVLAPGTIYRDVRSLEPGHWLLLENGRISTRQYWDVDEFDCDERSDSAIVEALDGMLGQHVAERLESEVPLGAFLSGGVDSGLVVSHMAEAVPGAVETISVGFRDQQHNELEAAALTAAMFRTSHHAELIEPDLHDVLDGIVRAFDGPFADASAIPTWYVSRAARRYVTVALSGDGGDETFAGYGFRYVPHALEEHARRLLPAPGRRLVAAVGAVWPRSRHLPRWLRVGGVLQNIARDPAAAYYWDLCFSKPDDSRSLLGLPCGSDPLSGAVYEAVTAPYRRCPSRSAVQRAEYADLKVYLPNDVLTKVDRMSMAHGLEVRCPLLDRRLVEFAFRVPASTKMPRFHEKHLLRRLAAKRLPDGLSTLPKRGFTAPVSRWLKHEYRQSFIDDVLKSGSSVGAHLDLRRVGSLHADHVNGTGDHGYTLWAVWILARWLDAHV